MARGLTWLLLYCFAIAVMAVAFGFAIGFGIPPWAAAAPFIITLAWQWAQRMFDALGLR
jgi:hypothetical protein